MTQRAPHTGAGSGLSSAPRRPVLTRTASTVILVVEDDDRLRQIVMDSLHGPQYWVLVARNGEEACGLFNEHWQVMSLLMTEVVLPGTDGCALTARARECVPDLPVLYMADEDQLPDLPVLYMGPAVRGRASGCGTYPQLLPDEALRS